MIAYHFDNCLKGNLTRGEELHVPNAVSINRLKRENYIRNACLLDSLILREQECLFSNERMFFFTPLSKPLKIHLL